MLQKEMDSFFTDLYNMPAAGIFIMLKTSNDKRYEQNKL